MLSVKILLLLVLITSVISIESIDLLLLSTESVDNELVFLEKL